MRITRIILTIMLFFPALGFGQNVITHITFEKIPNSIETPGYESYKIEVRPGYKDYIFKFELVRTDTPGTETTHSTPEIKLEMKVHKKNDRMPDGKEEWDYETEIITNDTYSDENFDIGKCADSKHLVCLVSVKEGVKYKVRVWNAYEVLRKKN
ncbi:MAG: hypothetical protein AB2L26_00580 [Ignavibacteria bacterium]